MNFKNILKEPPTLFIVLNILDAIFTYISLIGINTANELNPFYRYLFVLFGISGGLIILKTMGILFMLYIYYKFINEKNRYILIKVFKYINLAYILIVLNNLYWIIRKIYII